MLAERTNHLREQLAEAVGSREVADSCEEGERAAIEQNIGLACGLELKLSLAAVDVANAARAVLHAEKRKTAIVGRIVVLADAYHVLEARLTNFIGAYLVVGEFGFAFHDSIRPASTRKARTWHSPQARAKRLCRVTWKTTACRRPARRTRTGAREAAWGRPRRWWPNTMRECP